MKTKRAAWTAWAVVVFIGIGGSATAVAGDDNVPRISPPGSHAYGRALTEWLSI